MTCCVAINAKEGDCWIQLFNCVLSLMLHKCHISLPSSECSARQLDRVYRVQTVREASYRVYLALQNAIPSSQSLPSSVGLRRICEGKSVFTEFAVLTEFSRLPKNQQCSPSISEMFMQPTEAIFIETCICSRPM